MRKWRLYYKFLYRGCRKNIKIHFKEMKAQRSTKEIFYRKGHHLHKNYYGGMKKISFKLKNLNV